MDVKNSGAGRQLEDVYIISAVRTPIGGYRKMLKKCSPVYLGVVATKEAIRKAGSVFYLKLGCRDSSSKGFLIFLISEKN